MTCPKDSCTSSANEKSFIVEVHLIGSDGFEKPLESWSGNKHTNWKTRYVSTVQYIVSLVSYLKRFRVCDSMVLFAFFYVLIVEIRRQRKLIRQSNKSQQMVLLSR